MGSTVMNTTTRGIIAISVWSARLLGLAVMIVAVGEMASLTASIIEQRKREGGAC